MNKFIYLGSEWAESHEKLYLLGDSILFLLFLLGVLYLFTFAFFSLKKRKDVYPKARKRSRFAVLFPAYNEDEVILHSIKDFLRQEYPREKYDIIVISDHMSDETNKMLQDLSAKVVKITEERSTKSNALQKAIKYIEEKQEKYDIVVILDADNQVPVNYLDKINDAFYSGCSVVQTHRVAKNLNTDTAVLDAVSEEINNSIFRKGHVRLGFSSALIGSGMAFEYHLFRDNIRKVGPIGVDKQLEKVLLSQYIYIEYLEDVYGYDEKIQGNKGFYNQRRRWLANQFAGLVSGITQLPKAVLRGNWDYCDKLLQWAMPPRIILLGFIVLFAVFFTLFDWALSIKWWFLLVLLGITFSIAVPDNLVDHRFRKALKNLPFLFILMFLNFFRIRGANKRFIHTKHSHIEKLPTEK